MNIRILSKADIILIVCIGIIAGLILAWNTFSSANGSSQITAEITQDGKLIKKIDLNEIKNSEYVNIDSNGIKQIILAEKGRIRFSESNCRDKICVKSGWLTKAGDKAVCLPAKTVINIVGDSEQIDSISF